MWGLYFYIFSTLMMFNLIYPKMEVGDKYEFGAVGEEEEEGGEEGAEEHTQRMMPIPRIG